MTDPRLDPIISRMSPVNAGFWCPTGWNDLIIQLDKDLAKTDPGYQIGQVKEKFGGLRYYVGAVSAAGRSLIREAENKSFFICQECGQPGKLRRHGWAATLCDEHDHSNCDRGYEFEH